MIKRICIWGDSISQGYNDFENEGWVHLLKRDLWLESFNKRYEVMNLSINGNTSRDVKERFLAEYLVRKPQVAIIAIGINNSVFDKLKNNNLISTEETENNLQEIIDFTDKKETRVAFVGLTNINEKLTTPVSWNENLFYLTENIKKYDAVIKKVAEKNNNLYCSMFDVLNNEDLPDGLHPDPVGHRKMFERIKKYLLKFYEL